MNANELIEAQQVMPTRPGQRIKLADATKLVRDEAVKGETRHGPYASSHEAYAVLKEEVEELWDEIKKNSSKRDLDAMRNEAVQVAAVALRLVACGGDFGVRVTE